MVNNIRASATELAEIFIAKSPDFPDDLSIPDIDSKHKKVVSSAYEMVRTGEDPWRSFRGWAGQDDGLAPVDLSFNLCRDQGLLRTILRYCYYRTLRRGEDEANRSTLVDDVDVIRLAGAARLLEENPVSSTLGAKNYCRIGGYELNQRWARYIYLLKRILDLGVLQNGGVWVDVGSFYGGLQGLVRKYCPSSKIIMVDFHHQLCRSYIHLASMYPDAKHILPGDLAATIDFNELPTGSITYLPVSYFSRIENASPDLATNFFSLGEMRRSHFEQYINSVAFRDAKFLFLVNRVVGAPFFDATYDTDITILDYLGMGRKINYFDIFPMHHYQLSKRILFGRKFFRNISSSYFECVSSRS